MTGPYQVMPPLSAEQYEGLRASILEFGVKVPVEVDEAGNILDGHNRAAICEAEGIAHYPKIIRRDLASDEEKRAYARSLNLNRRHLAKADRDRLIADQLRDTPSISDRALAARLGVDHKTVGTRRKALVGRGEIPHVEELTDTLGRQQPRAKTAPLFVDDSPEGRSATVMRAQEIRDQNRKASLRANIGTKTASAEDRGLNLYETPSEAVEALLAVEEFRPMIWEPACGRGAISRVLEEAAFPVFNSDIEDRDVTNADGQCQEVVDFLETDRDWLMQKTGVGKTGSEERPSKRAKSQFLAGGEQGEPAVSEIDLPLTIITNPPYGEDVLNRFIAHALKVHRPAKMALLLNLNFQCGCADPDRQWIWDFAPPARVHVFSRRLPMMHRDGWDGPKASSSMNTAWFVWERVDADRLEDPAQMLRLFPGRVDPDAAEAMLERFPYGIRTELRRVDWKDHANV